MRRLLVTGANGFVGRRLIARLARDNDIWAISRSGTDSALSGVQWLSQDLTSGCWNLALPARIDAVVHLAQSSHFRDFPAKAADIYAVSAGTTMRLLDWAVKAGARHFVLASTGGLYGTSPKPVCEADSLPTVTGPLGFYFATKRASELLVEQYSEILTGVVLRCFFVYGSGQAQQMLMPRLVGNIREGRPIQLQGEAGININPIHVDDAVRAIERALGLSAAGTFNVAGPETASLREIATQIGEWVGRPAVFDIDRVAKPGHLVADIGRMSRLLGAPSIGIAAGIAELCGATR